MQNIKQLIATKLLALSESISIAEKEEAMTTLKMSRPTLDEYLSGDTDKMAKVETGQELLEFFTEKVRQRIEKIRETNLV